jgi:glucose-6-phosphate 1-dehydrogenase
MTAARSDALVFFGSTGDLAFKQIYPALEALVRAGRLDMPIVATGRKELPIEQLRARAKESLTAAKVAPGKSVDKLLEQLRYVAVDYDKPESFDGIREAVGGARRPVHYVALPPEVFESVAKNLSKAGLAKDARLVLEKPFGHDSASAKALSKALHAYFSEEAIFRVDHFLGKEPVENIVYFRAANPLVENSWSAAHVESIQITMAEKFGVKGRAKFYDSVGAIRDVVQNHLLQVVGLLAMEPPVATLADGLRDEQAKLFRSIAPLDARHLVRGQFRGYRDEPGVDAHSDVETFAAVRLQIDTWRWAGVPFFIRAGKKLPATLTEVIVDLKRPPLPGLAPEGANYVRFRLGPEVTIAVGARVKKPGEAMTSEAHELSFDQSSLHKSAGDEMTAYERLLGDALAGDATLFAREDAVEAAWAVVEPILNAAAPVSEYEPGSWGPAAADALAADIGGWDGPGPRA